MFDEVKKVDERQNYTLLGRDSARLSASSSRSCMESLVVLLLGVMLSFDSGDDDIK